MRQSTARMGEYTPTSDAAPGRALSNHTDRSGTTIHGRRSIAFGSLFAIPGIALGVLALQGQLNASRDVPLWIGLFSGGLFAVAGLSFVAHGFAGLQIQRRVRGLRATHAGEPWVWDHPWDGSGSRDDSGRRIGRAIWFTGFLALFMVPFNWVAFFSPDRALPFAFVAGLMDCGVVAGVWWVVYLISRRTKYGVSRLRFRRFPFHVGGEVELHLARPAALAAANAPVARLRCVQERYEIERSGGDSSRVVVAYEVWAATATAEFQRGEYVWRFSIPGSVPGTALSKRPPRYWELELKIATPGVDYAGTFLVPIYEDGRRR